MDGKYNEYAVISIGNRIINQTSSMDAGSLALKYGGGGHRQAGTCQVAYKAADHVLIELLKVINST